MFNIELGEHGVQPGSICVDVDHICGDVATLELELFDLLAVGAQNLLGGSIHRQVCWRFPAFVVNANPGEVITHLALFVERTVFIRDSKDCHGNQLLSSAGAEFTRSARRRSEPALPSGIPEFQRGAWLPASLHPKYKAHAPSEEIHGCRGYPGGSSKRVPPVQPCLANSRESAATRDAYAFERLPVL